MRTRHHWLTFTLILAFALLPGTAQAQTAPSEELLRLQRMLRQHPRDPIALYNLAAIRAGEGNRVQTLRLLDQVSRAVGGLDPWFYRRFIPLRGDSAFDAIVARIREANPPRVRGAPAFTITERDLQPEGIAFHPASRSLFVGSFKGKIVRIDSTGKVADFATPGTPASPRVVVGVRVDTTRHHLWAVVDDPRAFSSPDVMGAALHQYDIVTGRELARYHAQVGAFNDVVIAPDGQAYATSPGDGSIWRATPGVTGMTAFLPAGSVLEANGIAISPDGRQLFVAGWHDIQRVDLRTRAVVTIPSPRDLPLGSFDGLYWYRDGLVGIQNGIHPGRVIRIALDRDRRRVVRTEILERYHPLSNGTTTGALDGDTFYYFANTQSRAFAPDGNALPGVVLQDIVILKMKLETRD